MKPVAADGSDMAEADRILERATVNWYEPPVFGLEEPMWLAEDEETNSAGVGRHRVEAEGNLVAVVESHGEEPGGYVKLPGTVHRRTWEDEDGLLGRLRDRFT